MLSAWLIRMIETHAEDLTREVLNDLGSNPRTPYMHGVSQDEMHRRLYDLYHNLGRWLGDQTDAVLEAAYAPFGRKRRAEGVPLSEVICAMILVKEHLRSYIRRAAAADSAVELYQEAELNVMIGHFFDKALYFTVKGYEDAQAAGPPAARRAV
jgi:hypothetical protein